MIHAFVVFWRIGGEPRLLWVLRQPCSQWDYLVRLWVSSTVPRYMYAPTTSTHVVSPGRNNITTVMILPALPKPKIPWKFNTQPPINPTDLAPEDISRYIVQRALNLTPQHCMPLKPSHTIHYYHQHQHQQVHRNNTHSTHCLLYTSPSPRDS